MRCLHLAVYRFASIGAIRFLHDLGLTMLMIRIWAIVFIIIVFCQMFEKLKFHASF